MAGDRRATMGNIIAQRVLGQHREIGAAEGVRVLGEVAQGSQHYSVLFGIGIVLFVITFAINMVAGRLVGMTVRRKGGSV